MGPFSSPAGRPGSNEVYGPQPPQKEEDQKLVLAFGPGLARGMAAAGVLAGLKELNLPVARIYTHEGSALATSIQMGFGNANRSEWAFLQLGDLPLARSSAGVFGLIRPESRVEARFKEIFGEKRLEELKPEVLVALYGESGRMRLIDTGSLREILRAALGGTEDGLKPSQIQDETYVGRGVSVLEFIRAVSARERAPICYVAFQPLLPEEIRLLEEREIEILKVPVDRFPESDYKHRKDITFQGKRAVQRAAVALKKMIRMSDDAQENQP